MREAARAITRSREAYDTLPDPSGVRANPGLVGDGGFQDRESMDAWVQAQRAALAEEREKESARHYRQYSASMTAAADDLARTLPDRGPAAAARRHLRHALVARRVHPAARGRLASWRRRRRAGRVVGRVDGRRAGGLGQSAGRPRSAGAARATTSPTCRWATDDSGTGTGSDDDPARRR